MAREWADSDGRQHRVIAEDDDKQQQVIDAMLYIVRLRNLVRAAELVSPDFDGKDLDTTRSGLLLDYLCGRRSG